MNDRTAALGSNASPARPWAPWRLALLCLLLLGMFGCSGATQPPSNSPPPPTPSITSLSVNSGPVGTPLTITGANFGASQGSSTITFNGTAATVSSWSATTIVTSVPSGATTGIVVVTVGGTASNGMTFTVTTSSAPSISSLSPASGPVGTSVSINGANFGASQGTSTVKFNGTTATPTSWGNTAIVASVPSGATTGSVVVTVGGTASNAMTFTVTSVTPGTPAFVNGQRQVNTFLANGAGNSAVSGACDDNPGFLPYHFCLADSSLAGNAIIAACTWDGSGGSPTLADDKSQTYTAAFGTPPNDGSRAVQIWYVLNSVAGVHELSLNFGGSPGGIQCGAYQVQNIATAAANCGTTQASGSGTSVAAGSFTPFVDNCFIFQVGASDSAPSGTWSAGAGFTLQDASPREGFAVQTLAQGKAAAINPVLTTSASNGWVTAAIALQSASSGSASPGMHVVHISQNALVDGKSSYTFQFPCSGNLVVVLFNGNTGESLASVTGTNPAATYTQVGAGVVGGEGIQQIWQSPANIACTQNHTITITGTSISLGDVAFYDVTGAAATSPLDSSLATATGDQGPFSSPLPMASITPSSNDGILFCVAGIADNGSASFHPTGYQDNQDENNGWGHLHYTSTSSIATSWGTDKRQTSGGIGPYSEACAAFKSATATASLAPRKRALEFAEKLPVDQRGYRILSLLGIGNIGPLSGLLRP